MFASAFWSLHGAPSEILNDNGSHFVTELIKESLALVDVDHKIIVAYSKEENAMVERANKEVNRDFVIFA